MSFVSDSVICAIDAEIAGNRHHFLQGSQNIDVVSDRS